MKKIPNWSKPNIKYCELHGHDWQPEWFDRENGIVFYVCFECQKECYKKITFYLRKEFNLENDYGESSS